MFQEKFIPNIQELYLDESLGPQKYKHALSNIMTDWTFGIHAMDLLESHQSQSYAYQFNVPSPLLDGRLGAYHSSELPYLFGSCAKEFSDWCSKDAKEISDFLQVSWTQFAKTGSPASHLLDWPSYEATNLVAQINSKFELKSYNNVKKLRLINEAKIIY
jgi:carboxylesterase type B